MIAYGDEEVRLILSSRIELEYKAVKKWPLGRNVGHTGDQMFALKWPQVAGHRKGKEREAKWLAGTPNGSGVPFPSAEVNSKKEFLSKARGRRTIAILLRAKDKRLTETWETRFPKASTKNRTKSISPWKKKNSPVEPRRKR